MGFVPGRVRPLVDVAHSICADDVMVDTAALLRDGRVEPILAALAARTPRDRRPDDVTGHSREKRPYPLAALH